MKNETNHDKVIEEKVEEFNKPNSNDSVLGRYIRFFFDYIWGEIQGDHINKLEDEKINNWLRQALQDIYQRGREDERDRILIIIAQWLDNGFEMQTLLDKVRSLKVEDKLKPKE